MGSDSLDSYKRKCNTESSGDGSEAATIHRVPCGKRCISRVVEVGGKQVREYRRVMCKKWRCTVCGPKKKKALSWAIGQAVEKYNLVGLMTLTLDPKKIPAGVNSCKYIKAMWRKFRVPVSRYLGKSLSFIWVMELQKNGRAHLHILIDAFLPQRWVSAKWSRYGGGRIVDVRAISSAKAAAWYVSKYLSKGLDGGLADRERRYGKSKNIQLFEKKDTSEWVLLPWGFNAIRNHRNELVLETEYDEYGNPIIFTADREVDYDPEEEYPGLPF